MFFLFFNDTATTEIYTLSLHDALPIYSPAGRLVVATDRTWADANGNYVPDCDLKSPLASGECGPMANQNFGTSRGATLYADELKRGWGVSPYLWQLQAAVQHELISNVALNAG